MSEAKNIFIDTAPFIYLLENHPSYAAATENLLTDYYTSEHQLHTSVISYMEFCVIPEREKRHDVIESFNELLLKLNIRLVEIDLRAATRAIQVKG